MLRLDCRTKTVRNVNIYIQYIYIYIYLVHTIIEFIKNVYLDGDTNHPHNRPILCTGYFGQCRGKRGF